MSRDRQGRLGRLLPAIAVSLCVLLLAVAAVIVTDRRYAASTRSDLEARAGSIGLAVNQSMASHAATTQALAAWATENPDVEQNFRSVAARLMQVQTGVRALELAPDGVISMIHPLAGNEAALGLDLNVHPSGSLALEELRTGTRIIVEGPIDLAQGGRAAILRARVDMPAVDPTLPAGLWGLAINVIDLDSLLDAAGLGAGVDELTWGLFAGPGAVSTALLVAGTDLRAGDPIRTLIDVPGGTWELALRPAAGWPSGSPYRGLLLAVGVLLALAIGALTHVVRREPRRLRLLVAAATAEVERSHQRTRAVMQAAGDAILAIDRNGDIIDWNPAALRLLRINSQAVDGRPVRAFAELAHVPLHDEDDGSRIGRAPLEVHRADGSAFPAEVCVAYSSTSTVRTVMIRDVTEQQRQHADLRRHVLELERLNSEQSAIDALKRDFMQMASHEVRTPITAIRGFALTLNRHWDQLAEEDRRRSLDVIHRQATRLWQLLNNILTTSQLEGGSLEQRVASVHVASTITAAITESQVPQQDVTVDCAAGLTACVDGDHLTRVLVSLITNAEKYGSSPINIAVRMDGSDLVIRVTDHGPGVPFSFRSRLFEPFSQASTGVRREAVGTGLGLAVARGLARANGGDVWHEDHPGVGATFALRFPRNSHGNCIDTERRIPAAEVLQAAEERPVEPASA